MRQRSVALAYLPGILGLLLATALANSIPAHATDRLALLIGNSRYEHATPLRNPENDVDLIDSSLRKADFRSVVGKNVSKQQLDQLIEDFVAAARAVSRPVLLVYFSGHGIERDGKNFLVPIDADPNTPAQLAATSVDANDLLTKLRAINPELAVLILDACRDDPENRTKSLRRGLVPIPLEPAPAQRIGQLVAYATSPGKTAADGDAGNSPYASALAEQMIVPGKNAEAVFRETRKKVVERTKGTQEPREDSALYEDFHFIPADRHDKLDDGEALVWDLASMVNSAEGYQRYLDKFPRGLFSEIAQRKIAAINTAFTYRRKAETFPIMQYTFYDFPLCRKQTSEPDVPVFDLPFYVNMFDDLDKLDGQLVYADFSIPLPHLFCGTTPEKINYGRVTEIGSKEKTCGNFPTLGYPVRKGLDGANVRCDDPKQWGDAPGGKPGAGWPEGGVALQLSTHYKLVFPHRLGNSYATEIRAPEGQWHEAYVNIRGLVRIALSGDDGFFIAHLAPVDARDVGLSWKFDNSAAVAKEQALKKRAAIDWKAVFDGIVDLTDEENLPEPEARAGSGTSIANSIPQPSAVRVTPGPPKRTYWAHNGSVVYLHSDGAQRQFYYEQPRPGMIEAGAKAGTLLFDGTSQLNRYSGRAFVFNRTCGPAAYNVSGPILDDGKKVVLEGKAPRVTKGCKVSGYVADRMEFTFMPERSSSASR